MLLIKVKCAGWRKAASRSADFEDSTERARWKRLSGDHHLHLLLDHLLLLLHLPLHHLLLLHSIISSSSSSERARCKWLSSENHQQRLGNVKKGATSNIEFLSLLHLFLHLLLPLLLLHLLLLLLLLCRLTAALWARATKPVPTRHASKKQERGNADLERDRKVKGQGHKQTKWRRKGGRGHLCNISEVLVRDELCIIYSGKYQEKPKIVYTFL